MSKAKPFLTDVKTLRERARANIEDGAITPAYRGDAEKTCSVVNGYARGIVWETETAAHRALLS